MPKYDFKDIEAKWQKYWQDNQTFVVKEDKSKKKFYSLIEFPYPSGEGLHVGHPRPFTAMDVISRKKRMEGYNVLYPIGFDAFGLPTENYAIKTGRLPAEVTAENIANFTRQLQMLGYSFDWSRMVNTTDPAYYKWTQWIFLQFFKHGLAYKKNMPINWCLSCKIGLANEEVVDGRCERCGGEVVKRDKEQWMLAITKYAEKLLSGLDEVDYIERAKIQQENWIGRKEGINIEYAVKTQTGELPEKIACFTTRPDTNFGATFVVVAPESEFVQKNIEKFENQQEIDQYIKDAKNRSDMERIAEGHKKTGVFTGLYAMNNLNQREMPIYVSDFVLATVGTGAVVGVPGHDLRDFEFAKTKRLDIVRVVVGKDGDESEITRPEQVQEEAGTMINSDFLNGMDIHEATTKIMDYLEDKGWGKRVINYKLRDWVFSRQRYWGEPIPLVNCLDCGWVPMDEKDLPLELPKVEKYEPTDDGQSPLALMTDWVNTVCPKCGQPAKRETDTMPNWAGSSWYYLRYMDPYNNEALASQEKMKYWGQIDWYNGGMEHTVLHLLYSRFWNQFLYDIGVVPFREPYKKRTSHGMILGPDGEKMSKSRGNVINPDEMVKKFGSDAFRLYIMFMGPFDQAVMWDTNGLVGVKRFLDRVWNLQEKLISDEQTASMPWGELESLLHQTIKKVGEDIDNMRFNTAIAKLMELVNEFYKHEHVSKFEYSILIKLLSPFAPHLGEELWQSALGYKNGLAYEPWPKYDPNKIVADEFVLAVQINGKLRDTLPVKTGITQELAIESALSSLKIQKHLAGKKLVKVIYVPSKLVNIVI